MCAVWPGNWIVMTTKCSAMYTQHERLQASMCVELPGQLLARSWSGQQGPKVVDKRMLSLYSLLALGMGLLT